MSHTKKRADSAMTERDMEGAAYFRGKAAQCRRLMRQAYNPDVLEMLRKLAAEFEEKAAALSEPGAKPDGEASG